MSLVTIQGRFILLDGTPMVGSVSFAPSVAVILNRDADVIISGAVFTAELDATGFFQISIPATDDENLDPTLFTYRVQEPTGRTYSISVPENVAGGVIDLIDVQPVPGSPGQSSLLLRGIGIESIDVASTGDVTVHYDNGETQLAGNVVGTAGPMGPQGVPGPEGPQGPAGVEGPEGPQGPLGPQGVAGPTGPVGPAGLTWRGTWSSATDYVADDAVAFDGASYFAVGDPAAGGSDPTVDTTNWQPLALRGAAGPQGSAGPQGTQGTQGIQGEQGIQGPIGPEGPEGPVGPEGPQGIPGEGSVSTVNGDPGPAVVLDAADVGAAPSAHTHSYLPLTGGTLTGAVNVPALDSLKTNGSLTNKTFTTDITQIAQAPFAGLWHDLLAFHQGIGTPTYETSDGAVWTAATLDSRLFSMKEDQQFGIVNGTTVKAARWTWTGTDFSKGTWLVLGHAFISGGVNKTVTVESSVDGTSWTTRHTSTYSTTAQPVWHWLADYIGDTRLRLTITWNSGGEVRLSTVRLLTARWGDQGGGREAEFPYEWDEQRRIGIGGAVRDTNTQLTITGRTYSSDAVITGKAAPTTVDELTRKDYVDGLLSAHAAAADPHPVYLTQTEGDTRYPLTSDSRLADARTPTAHKTSHATGGSDVLTPADIGAIATSARAAVNGVASLDGTTKVPYAQLPTGTAASTVAAGNDSRITGAQQTSAKGAANGYASLDASIKVPYAQLPTGTAASTVAAGDDTRLTNARTPTAHKTSHAVGGSDVLTPADIAAAAVVRQIIAGSGLTGGGDFSADRSLSVLFGATSGTAAQGNDIRFVPAGGSTSQILTKTGAGDHAMAWADAPAGGGLGGWVDCSAMTTAAAINSASLAAAAFGSATIWLGRRGAGFELDLEASLVLRPNQRILGMGGRDRLTRVRAGASFPAGQPVIAAAGYLNNATSADSPASVVGVDIDCAAKTGSHGLVVYNFWSHFEDVQVWNADGTAAHGMHVTDRGIDGTSVSLNSHSENTFVRCRFSTFTNGASAFWAENTNGQNNSNQDGHLVDSFFASINGIAIRITRSAGWTISNNHLYGIGLDAISLNKCYATKVIGNYIENFGQQDVAGGTYEGINMAEVLDTRASIVALNTVSVQHPLAPVAARYACYSMRAGSGQLRANLVMIGNTAVWASGTIPTTTKAYGYWVGENADVSDRMLNIEWVGNQVENLPAGWWVAARQVNNTGNSVKITEPVLLTASVAVAAATGTIALDASLGNNRDLTATGNITLNPPTSPVPNQVLQISVLASGAARTVTFGVGLVLLTGIAASYAPGSGKVLRISMRYSSLLAAWVVEAAAITQ